MEAELVVSVNSFYIPKLPQGWCVPAREPAFPQLLILASDLPLCKASGYGEIMKSEYYFPCFALPLTEKNQSVLGKVFDR